MKGFNEGYSYFTKLSGGSLGAIQGAEYVNSVVNEIEKLNKDINSFSGFNTASDKLKGDVAEFWHSGTFNINSAVKGSSARTMVDRSHGLGSADIISNSGTSYGLKYNATGADTAKQQAKSLFERFKEQKAIDSFDKYLENNEISSDAVMSDPLYSGQIRIIPADQLNEAINFLERKIAKEGVIRPEQLRRYQETLALLRTKISEDGVSSIELTKKEAEIIANNAKAGKFNADDYGLNTENLIRFENILLQAWEAGLSAAVISAVLKTAPEIIKVLEHLVKQGELDGQKLKNVGLAALTGASEGFVRGALAAALTTSCKAGLFGARLKAVNPTIIGAITVLVMNTTKDAFLVAIGKKTRKELIDKLVKDVFVTTSSLLVGSIGQALLPSLPIVGFMLGSFIGSVLGSFAYSASYNAILSFCIDTGFTMFKLVEQDYRLPKEVMEELGLQLFEYEKVDYNKFEYQKIELSEFEYDQFAPCEIGVTILRRGVIGVRRIGYV